MSESPKKNDSKADIDDSGVSHSRRKFLKGIGTITAAAGATASMKPAWGGATLQDAMGDFFQDHYQRMTPEEMADALARIERKAQRKFGREITCGNTPPLDWRGVWLRAEYFQMQGLS